MSGTLQSRRPGDYAHRLYIVIFTLIGFAILSSS